MQPDVNLNDEDKCVCLCVWEANVCGWCFLPSSEVSVHGFMLCMQLKKKDNNTPVLIYI